MGRVIYHIDLNAFFASAEILLDPSLEGKAGRRQRSDQAQRRVHRLLEAGSRRSLGDAD